MRWEALLVYAVILGFVWARVDRAVLPFLTHSDSKVRSLAAALNAALLTTIVLGALYVVGVVMGVASRSGGERPDLGLF